MLLPRKVLAHQLLYYSIASNGAIGYNSQVVRPSTQFKGKILAQLVHVPDDELWEAAFDAHLTMQDAEVQAAFAQFMTVALRNRPDQRPSRGEQRFVVSATARARPFRTGTVKGRILQQLAALDAFTKEQFTKAVAVAMRWDAEAATFGVDTRFASLRPAVQAWFATLRKEQLVVSSD